MADEKLFDSRGPNLRYRASKNHFLERKDIARSFRVETFQAYCGFSEVFPMERAVENRSLMVYSFVYQVSVLVPFHLFALL